MLGLVWVMALVVVPWDKRWLQEGGGRQYPAEIEHLINDLQVAGSQDQMRISI